MIASRGARLKEASLATLTRKGLGPDGLETPARGSATCGSTPPRAWDVEEVEASSAQSEGSSGPVSARSGGLSAEERESVGEGRVGRSLTREVEGRSTSSKDRRTAVSPFRSLPDLHPHEVELRVAVKDLSREVAPEKFRSKTKGVGGFVFGLLVFPQGTKSAPEHAKKNRPSKDADKEEIKAGAVEVEEKSSEKDEVTTKSKKETRWISAFVEARPTEDYPPHWFFEDVQFLVSLINFEDLKKSIVKHDKHTFSPVESSDGKAIDRGWHDFVHCDEATLRNNGFVDAKDDTVCFRASVYLAGGAMKVSPKTKSRYMSLSKIELSGPYEKVPNFLSSLVQLWYHIGHFRGVVYGAPTTAGAACAPASGSKRGSCVLSALREVFMRLQARSPPASCSALCAAFGRRMWSRICEAEPDAFCLEVFRALEAELTTDLTKADGAGGNKKDGKTPKSKASTAKVDQMTHDQRMLWESVRELFEFEVEWSAQSIEGGDFSDSSIFQGPVFTFVVRGFISLESALDHYFSPKIIEDGSGLRVKTSRRFRRLPMVLQWYLKRGDYDCCTGLCGLTDTFLAFPRQLDMTKYCEPSCRAAEGQGVYLLYGVMVESDDHYWSYIRPEMEGDQGQWYRFDDRESATCAMSNATAIDASFGGEEWLCVNYLYGPSAVLTRPKESRACLLIYLKEGAMDVLLHEPRLPKISREIQSAGIQRESALREAPGRAIEAEAANAAAQALLEEEQQEAQKEERKRKQKQKKKQKEKEKKSQARRDATLSDSPCDDKKSDGKASPVEGLSDDELPMGVTTIPSTTKQEVLASLGSNNKKKLGGRATGSRREPSVDSCGSNGFEEPHRTRVRWRSKADENSDLKGCGQEAPLVDSLCSKDAWLEAHRSHDKPRRRGARSPDRDRLPRDRTSESNLGTGSSAVGSAGPKDAGAESAKREQRQDFTFRSRASGSCSASGSGPSGSGASTMHDDLRDNAAGGGAGSSAGSSGVTDSHARSGLGGGASSSAEPVHAPISSGSGGGRGSNSGASPQLTEGPTLGSGGSLSKVASSPSKPARTSTGSIPERGSPSMVGNRRGDEGGGRAVSSKASPTPQGEPRPNGTEAASPSDRSEHASWKEPASPAKSQPKALAADGRGNVGLSKASPSKPVHKQRGEAPMVIEPLEGIASRASPSSSSRSPGRRSSPMGSPGPLGGMAADDAASLVRVFPQQLVTQDVGGALGEYAQFVCKICHLVVRSPLVLPCAHMFCSKCFDQWVQQKRPNVECPTCKTVVRQREEVKHFESRSSSTSNGPATGGALGLLYRLYSGMKVRCVYHPELLGTGKLLTKEAERASGSSLSCNWRGALHDYTNHLTTCEVHAVVASIASATPGAAASSAGVNGPRGHKASGRQPLNSRGQAAAVSPLGAVPVAPPVRGELAPPSKASPLVKVGPPHACGSAVPSTPAASSRSGPGWTQVTGAFQVLTPWHSPEAGALCVQQGATLWVTSTDESGEWAYARMLVPPTLATASSGAESSHLHAWVPSAVLQRAVYPTCSIFDANGQAQGLTLHLGDFVHVYHREASGWTYGARLERSSKNGAGVGAGSTLPPEEVGWFPEACIMEPLPVA